MNLEELIYKAWENPTATDIEEDVIGVIETTDGFDKPTVDKIVNRIYNVSDVYLPDSVDWMERVCEIARQFTGGE